MLHLGWAFEIPHQVKSRLQVSSHYQVHEICTQELESQIKAASSWSEWCIKVILDEEDCKSQHLSPSKQETHLGQPCLVRISHLCVQINKDRVRIQVAPGWDINSQTITLADFVEGLQVPRKSR